MSDEINDGLTDEERAALEINDDDAPGEPEAVVTAPAAEAEKTTEEPKDEEKPAPGDAPGAGDADADATAKPAAERAPAPAAEQEAAPSPAPQQAPILVAEAVADADTKLADIASQKDALATKFDDGDITAKEYHSQLDALNKQERSIERAQDKAQLASEMAEQQRMNAWFNQAQAFARDNGYTDSRRMNLLDAEVRAVATSDPNLSGTEVLAKAHQNLVDAGLSSVKAAAPAPKVEAAKKPAPEVPPSIHKLPAADVDDAQGGQWAELDRLATTNPLAYEAKLASMSEKDRDRYLAA